MKIITTSDNFITLEPCFRRWTARDCVCVICFGLVFQVKNFWTKYWVSESISLPANCISISLLLLLSPFSTHINEAWMFLPLFVLLVLCSLCSHDSISTPVWLLIINCKHFVDFKSVYFKAFDTFSKKSIICATVSYFKMFCFVVV